jgi:hypothetical protein
MAKKNERLFRIYPDNAQVYFSVKIFATTKALRAAYQDDGILGVCKASTRYRIHSNGRERLLPELGDVWFTRQTIGAAIVSHELTHATFQYFRWRQEQGFDFKFLGPRVKNGLVNMKEEAFCRVLSTMVLQFWNNFHRVRPIGHHVFPLDPVKISRWHKPRPESNREVRITL